MTGGRAGVTVRGMRRFRAHRKTVAPLALAVCLVVCSPVGAQAPSVPVGVIEGADADGDRVAGSADACPATRAGERAVLGGCSVGELLAFPSRGLAKLRLDLMSSAQEARRLPTLAAAGKRLDIRLTKTVTALSTVATRADGPGGICDAAKGAELATGAVRSAVTRYSEDASTVARADRAAAKRLTARRRPAPSLLQRRQGDLAVAATIRARVGATGSSSAGAAATLGRMCSQVSKPRALNGTVKTISGDRMSLTNGAVVLVAGAKISRVPTPGSNVVVNGSSLGNGPLVADTIQVAAAPTIQVDPSCRGSLMIGPPQAPTGGPWLYYPAEGFTDGKLLINEGTALGAQTVGLCGDINAIQMTWTDRAGYVLGTSINTPAKPEWTFTVASHLADHEKYEHYGRTFGRVARFVGLKCDASGCTTVGELGGGGEVTVGVVQPSRLDHGVGNGTPSTFTTRVLEESDVFGMGYPFRNDASSYPQLDFVLPGESYAVHYVPGQFSPRGLLWAYKHGTRNGSPYYYVAHPQRYVNDVLRTCVRPEGYAAPGVYGGEKSMQTGLVPPWAAGKQHRALATSVFKKGHKNGGTFYHPKWEGAWTFELSVGDKVLAPRRGIARIRKDVHVLEFEDGYSYGFVGIGKGFPKEGTIVERGAPIGTMRSLGLWGSDSPLSIYPLGGVEHGYVKAEQQFAIVDPSVPSQAGAVSTGPCKVPATGMPFG